MRRTKSGWLCLVGGVLGLLGTAREMRRSRAESAGGDPAPPSASALLPLGLGSDSHGQAYAALHAELLTSLAVPVVKPNPWDISAKLLPIVEKAQQLHAMGHTELAWKTLRSSNLNVNNARWVLRCNYEYTQGRVSESQGERVAARENYATCLRGTEPLPPLHQRYAQEGLARTSIEKEEAELKSLERSKDYRGMARVLERLATRWPRELQFQSEWAWALVRAGDGAAAKQVALKALPLEASLALKRAVRYNLGRAHELLGEHEAAIAAYRSALYPEDASELLGRTDESPPSESQLGEIAGALRRLGAFPLLPVARPLESDSKGGPGCEAANQPKLAPPFVAVSLCHDSGGDLELFIKTPKGLYRKPLYFDFDYGARDDHTISRAEVQQGKLLLQTLLRRGRWGSSIHEFLTICALLPSGVSCAGPVEIARASQSLLGSKESGFTDGPRKQEFEYRAQLLPGDFVQFTPVKRRPSVDLTGKVTLQFP